MLIPYQKTYKSGFKNLSDPKAIFEYSNNMQDIYKNIEEYSSSRECNMFIVNSF